MFKGDKGTMTASAAYRDYEYERRFSDIKRLEKAVEHFNQAVMRGMVAMKEIATAFEAVGGVFSEMTSANSAAAYHMPSTEEDPGVGVGKGDGPSFSALGIPNDTTTTNTTVASEAWESASMVCSTNANPIGKVNDATAAQMHRLTVLFAAEARRLNEGQPFLLYNTGVHRDVVNRLLPVVEHIKVVDTIAKKCAETLLKYHKYKSMVDKKEQQYAKKGKPFVDQGDYRKYVEKRDECWKAYTVVRSKFHESYRLLMEVHGHAVAHIIHRYLTLNGGYLRELLLTLERVLPAMESIYPTNAEFASQTHSILSAFVPMKVDDHTIISSQVNKEETKKEGDKAIDTMKMDISNSECDAKLQPIHFLRGCATDVSGLESCAGAFDGTPMKASLEMRLPGAAENAIFVWNDASDFPRTGLYSSVDTAPAAAGEGRGLYFPPGGQLAEKEVGSHGKGWWEMKSHDDEKGGGAVGVGEKSPPPAQEAVSKEEGDDESNGEGTQRDQAIYADPLARDGLPKR